MTVAVPRVGEGGIPCGLSGVWQSRRQRSSRSPSLAAHTCGSSDGSSGLRAHSEPPRIAKAARRQSLRPRSNGSGACRLVGRSPPGGSGRPSCPPSLRSLQFMVLSVLTIGARFLHDLMLRNSFPASCVESGKGGGDCRRRHSAAPAPGGLSRRSRGRAGSRGLVRLMIWGVVAVDLVILVFGCVLGWCPTNRRLVGHPRLDDRGCSGWHRRDRNARRPRVRNGHAGASRRRVSARTASRRHRWVCGLHSLREFRGEISPERALFNRVTTSLSVMAATGTFALFGFRLRLAPGSMSAALVAVAVDSVVNYGMIGGVIALHDRYVHPCHWRVFEWPRPLFRIDLLLLWPAELAPGGGFRRSGGLGHRALCYPAHPGEASPIQSSEAGRG